MIEAHGATYASKAEAEARIAELNEENLRYGASDGRVTEILEITEAMQAAGWEETPRAAAAAEAAAHRREFPFYCYTRSYKANGDCVKGYREFRTRAAQIRFMNKTSAAVTACN
jgi:hypothetical protein